MLRASLNFECLVTAGRGITVKYDVRERFSLFSSQIRALFFPWTYRTTVIVYIALFLSIMVPPLVRGYAIIPTSLAKSAAQRPLPADFLESPQWSDSMNVFMPTMYAHLHAPRSGWNAIWNPYLEMGRPLRPEWGFTPAYPLTWLMTLFTHDHLLLATLFSFHICFLAGLWLIGIAKEHALDPFAALVVAGLAATAPYFFHFMTHYTYIAMPACFFGMVYVLRRWARIRDVWGALGIIWLCYSYAIMGYYQEQVYGYYMLLGYVLVLAWSMRANKRQLGIWLTSIAGLAAIAGVLLIPYMYDFVQNVRLSVRSENTFDFFKNVINQYSSFGTSMRMTVRAIAPELVGSPRVPELPQPAVGYGQSPILLAFVVLGAARVWRTQWFWLLCIAVLMVVNVSLPVFQFMFDHLFFNLSRTKPLFIMVVPMVIVALFGADTFFRAWHSKTATTRVVVFAVVQALIVLWVTYLAYTRYFNHDPDWRVIITNAIIAVLLVAMIWLRNRAMWLLVVSLYVAGVSTPYLLWNSRAAVVESSSYTTEVRALLADGGRLGRTLEMGPVLTPNSSVLFDVPSVHSLNSVLPARYVRYVEQLGGQIINHSILNREIAPDYGSLAFWMSDIRIMTTILDLSAVPQLTLAKKVVGIKLYRVLDTMGCCIQVPTGTRDPANPLEVTISDPRPDGYQRLRKTLDLGDIYEVETANAQPGLIIISQQYHQQWRVFGWKSSEWIPLEPVAVNGLFQGAFVPAGVERVRFEFRPMVRYVWIAHFFFGGALLAAVGVSYRKRKTAVPESHSSRVEQI